MTDASATGVLVRAARADDADALVAGNLAMAQESEGRRLKRAVLAEGVRAALADASRGRYFVAESGGAIVGQLLITREWSDWRNGWFWWIQSVYVAPAYRRRGVFRRLYEHVRRSAREAGDVCGLRLYVDESNASAQATYSALGMVACGYQLFEEDWSGQA